jgi:hypothetical protein
VIYNADLGKADPLPLSLEVIIVDYEDDTPLLLAVKKMFYPCPKIEPDSQPATQMISQPLPSPKNCCYPSCNHSLPTHLKDYHLFATVAEDTYTDYWYCDARGKTVDLAIKNENMIVHVCHYVMLLPLEPIFVSTPNNKKQYSLKAGLHKFASQGSMAIMKELTQIHTLKCFKPEDVKQLSCNARRQALPPSCSSLRNALVRSKPMLVPRAAHNVHMWPRKKQLLQLLPWRLSLSNTQYLPMNNEMWPHVISLGLLYRLTILILF